MRAYIYWKTSDEETGLLLGQGSCSGVGNYGIKRDHHSNSTLLVGWQGGGVLIRSQR